MRVEEGEKNFLEKLQSADESIKKRWMIILTIIVMTVVVYVWIAYFNNLIVSMSMSQQIVSSPPADSGSLWQTAKNGMASLYGIFIDKVHGLGQILQAPREYIIKPPQ